MKKDTCDSVRAIDTKFLRKHKYLDPGYRGGTIYWRSTYSENSISISSAINDYWANITLNYIRTGPDGTKEDMKYTVQLESTSCHFGGKRWWLICPLIRDGTPCRRRVAKLYSIGKWFGCRRCGDYAYDSQSERRSGFYGAMGRYLDLSTDLDKYPPPRIKYWHGRPTKRYRKYMRKYEQLDDVASTFLRENKKMENRLSRKK